MNRNLGYRISLAGKLTGLVGVAAVALAVLFAGSMAFGSSTAYAGVATETPTVGPTVEPTPEPTVEPTATPMPGAMTFVGDIEVTEAEVCGGGTITLTLTPGDPGDGIAKVVVADVFVLNTAQTLTIEFDPAIAIAGDGTFSNTGPLPDPFAAINATLAGTFDFSADPATVAGSLTVGDAAAPLCEADFSAEALAAGAPAPTAAAVATALPATGTSVTQSTGSDGVLWATVAGIVAVFALGAAGAVAVRRRSVQS